MSWEGYITNLISSASVEDAVIAGCEPGQESVWAFHPGGWLKDIKPEEVKDIVSQDRAKLFQTGVTLAGRKCTVLRDLLFDLEDNTMDVKMKISDTEPIPYQFTIGKSHKALVMVRGEKGATGGNLNLPVFKVVDHLRKAQY